VWAFRRNSNISAISLRLNSDMFRFFGGKFSIKPQKNNKQPEKKQGPLNSIV
jgi:hypothetical protein